LWRGGGDPCLRPHLREGDSSERGGGFRKKGKWRHKGQESAGREEQGSIDSRGKSRGAGFFERYALIFKDTGKKNSQKRIGGESKKQHQKELKGITATSRPAKGRVAHVNLGRKTEEETSGSNEECDMRQAIWDIENARLKPDPGRETGSGVAERGLYEKKGRLFQAKRFGYGETPLEFGFPGRILNARHANPKQDSSTINICCQRGMNGGQTGRRSGLKKSKNKCCHRTAVRSSKFLNSWFRKVLAGGIGEHQNHYDRNDLGGGKRGGDPEI